jgi:3-dehydrosphinganine reductase
MKKKRVPFLGTAAFIAGGSRGIGRAVAHEFVGLGGSVCLIARSRPGLDHTARELSGLRVDDTQTISTISCDTTRMEALRPAMEEHIGACGTPDYLINFVGYAYPKRIEELTYDDFKKNMEVNYYGQLAPILVMLPHYMRERKGHIVTCSSVVGFLGMTGYATYSPTKYALVGLTETLRNELKPYNIRFSVLFPPDTDTPGLAKENETKPAEVKIMSEGGGLMSAEQVGRQLINGVLKKKFYILPGQSRLLWFIARHFPRLTHSIMDGELKKAKKRVLADG